MTVIYFQQVLMLKDKKFFENIHNMYWNINDRNKCPIIDDNQVLYYDS